MVSTIISFFPLFCHFYDRKCWQIKEISCKPDSNPNFPHERQRSENVPEHLLYDHCNQTLLTHLPNSQYNFYKNRVQAYTEMICLFAFLTLFAVLCYTSSETRENHFSPSSWDDFIINNTQPKCLFLSLAGVKLRNQARQDGIK